MVMFCVAPAAEFAANLTVPEVVPRSAAFAESVPSGADHATCTSASTAADNVTVNVASDPSATLADGPSMLSSAPSLSSVSVVVVLSSSVSVMVADVTVRPTSVVVVPGIVIVSSPSTTKSSVGVMVIEPVPVEEFAGKVMLASDVAV